jgi:hypothetical protein
VGHFPEAGLHLLVFVALQFTFGNTCSSRRAGYEVHHAEVYDEGIENMLQTVIS